MCLYVHHLRPDGCHEAELLQPERRHLSCQLCCPFSRAQRDLRDRFLWEVFIFYFFGGRWTWAHTLHAVLQVSYYRRERRSALLHLETPAAVTSGVSGRGRRSCLRNDWWMYFENIPSRACLRPGDWKEDSKDCVAGVCVWCVRAESVANVCVRAHQLQCIM